jgi:imidazolonepropionase-like amidohydrolase
MRAASQCAAMWARGCHARNALTAMTDVELSASASPVHARDPVMDLYLFKNFEMLDPEVGELRGGYELLVEGAQIREVSDKPIKAAKAKVIDCGKRTLMPGLIDSHVHVVLSEVVIRNMESVPLTLMTARAADLMRKMLDRGFTSVRDTGGADWGLKEATDNWLLVGPRLFIAGRAIGPTGGHSDGRRRTDRWASPTAYRTCAVPYARRCARASTR